MSRWPKILVRGTLIASVSVVGLCTVLVLVRAFVDDGCGSGPILNDTLRLREIVGLAIQYDPPRLPMKDGAFDPYAFVGRGSIPRERYDIFRSERLGTGPTAEEIERGDYANFPWERYRGHRELGGRFPLLWEKRPDKRGGGLVAYSDGSAEYVDRDRGFDAMLRGEAVR